MLYQQFKFGHGIFPTAVYSKAVHSC